MAERLPSCCAFRKVKVNDETSEVVRLARLKARRPDAVTLEQIAAAKDTKRQAIEVYEKHIHDESLEHR